MLEALTGAVAQALATIPPPQCPPHGGFLEETLRFVVSVVRILLGAPPC